jgi:hypothetical protein
VKQLAGEAGIAPALGVAPWRADGYMRNLINGGTMRAETQNLIDDIKQSVTLLRRHL